MSQTIGRYEILEELGRGAMGVVYKASDPSLNRIVAIKTTTTDGAGSDELKKRLLREASAAGMLEHPNIITIHDYGEHDGVPYMAMEYLEGIDLNQIIRRKITLTPSRTLAVLRQVAQALGYAHSAGVIHRDVKPANVRVLRDGRVKIMDFGIAHLTASQMTHHGTILGSVAYMAPEQIEGLTVDHRCDIFGYGVLAYELVMRRLPFDADTIPATLNAILTQEPKPIDPPRIEAFPWLEELILRCLRKDAAERYQNFDEVCQHLDDGFDASGRIPAARVPSALDIEDEDDEGNKETVLIYYLDPTSSEFDELTDQQLEELSISGGTVAAPPIDAISADDRFSGVSVQRPRRPILGKKSMRYAVALAAGAVLAATLWFLPKKAATSEATTPMAPSFITERLASAEQKFSASDYRGAVEDLELVLEVESEHRQARERLAVVRETLEAEYQRSLNRGRVFIRAAEFEKAAAQLELAVSLKPSEPGPEVLLTEARRLHRRDIETEEEAARALVEGLIAQARSYATAGRYEAAIAALGAAAEIEPDNVEVKVLLTLVKGDDAGAGSLEDDRISRRNRRLPAEV